MIDYIEIRRKTDRVLIGIIDTAQSIIWKSLYYGVGEFEVYVSATPENIEMLVEGNYITRPNNDECGIIEHIEITDDSKDGQMIIASGRFIKSILDRRIVYSATLSGTGYNYIWNCDSSTLKGNVEVAVRQLISDNAINSKDDKRNIQEVYFTNDDLSNLTEEITVNTSDDVEESAEKQVTYKNLLEYTDSILQEYQMGARMWLDTNLLKFRYKIYKGVDRSRENNSVEPIIFSKEFDNLTASSYVLDSSSYKNVALIGGEGEGKERKCAFVYSWIKGLERRETFIDASSITQEELTLEAYRKQLEAQGEQSIAELQKAETFDGEIDLTNSLLEYGKDYNLGDVITIEDKYINKYINARILAVTEVQDDDGYKIEIEYGI